MPLARTTTRMNVASASPDLSPPGQLKDIEALRRFFTELEPDSHGLVPLKRLVNNMRARTGLELGRNDDPPPQPSTTADTAGAETDAAGSTDQSRSGDSHARPPSTPPGDERPPDTGSHPRSVDFAQFCKLMARRVPDDAALQAIYTKYVEAEQLGEARTPPAMERMLFLSALANGKLQHHQADLLITVKRVVAGGLAGMLAKSVVAPVDRIKILFQVTSEQFSFRRVGELVRHIVQVEGARGLWKGNSATLIRVFPYAGTQFMVFDTIKRAILIRKSRHNPHAQQLSNVESLCAGSVAGGVSAFATYPLDLVRARLAVEVHKKGVGHTGRRRSVPQVLRSAWREGGWPSLYRGVTPSLMGIIPYAGIAFSINEQAKNEVRALTGQEPSTLHKLAIGAAAGLVAQSCTYPFEVIRRRMQTHGMVDHHSGVSKVFEGEVPVVIKRHGIVESFQAIIKDHGGRGLFKGLSMNWIKGPIGISISFTTFDLLKRRFGIVA